MPYLSPRADFARLVNHSRRVSEIILRIDYHGHRRPALGHRPAARIENLQDAKTVLAMRSRMRSFGDTLQEVFAFFSQWLFFRQRDHLAAVTLRDRLAILPIDSMCVQHKLFLGLQVVKDGHLLAADDAQLLFLKRVQPADENMSLYSARKLQCAQSCVHDWGIQVASALRRGDGGSLRQHLDDHGDIVGREAPQYVFFRTQFAQIQARGINILDLSELSRSY